MAFFKPRTPRIFVQIASYRDPECQWTVKDLFEQADDPDRVFVGICWQFEKKEDQECFVEPSPRPKQTRVLRIKASESKGVCWARHYAQTLYKDEEYVLMIDSHMRFVQGWDTKLIEELAKCDSKKALLTHYPPGYEPPRTIMPGAKLSVMVMKPFDAEGNTRSDGIVMETTPPGPVRGAFIAAGFLFAKAAIIVDVPYDPFMYFNQEEISMAVRLYTKGWDVYHPSQVFVYHMYKKAGDDRHAKQLHWSNDTQWHALHVRGLKRFHHLIGHKVSDETDVIKEIDHYGLGKKRSIASYEEFTGMDFMALAVSRRTTEAEFVPDIEIWKKVPQMVVEAGPLGAVTVGDYAPRFMLPASDGVATRVVDHAGKLLLLYFLPIDFGNYMEEFFAYRATRAEELRHVSEMFVIHGEGPQAEWVKKIYGVEEPVLFDASGTVQHVFGLGNRSKVQPMSVLLDRNQKIVAMYDDANAVNQLADVVRAVEAQPISTAQLLNQVLAPVTIVPQVLSLAMCETVRGGIDAAMVERLDALLVKSVLPEVVKVCGFVPQFREPYQLLRGTYEPRRDNAEKKERRYSLQIALNADFEGGWLHCPEYGVVHYGMEVGQALLFPSGVLQGISKMRGERVVLATYFSETGTEEMRFTVPTQFSQLSLSE